MSVNYKKWEDYYKQGWITKAKLRKLVGKTLGITAEEYEQITGEKF